MRVVFYSLFMFSWDCSCARNVCWKPEVTRVEGSRFGTSLEITLQLQL